MVSKGINIYIQPPLPSSPHHTNCHTRAAARLSTADRRPTYFSTEKSPQPFHITNEFYSLPVSRGLPQQPPLSPSPLQPPKFYSLFSDQFLSLNFYDVFHVLCRQDILHCGSQKRQDLAGVSNRGLSAAEKARWKHPQPAVQCPPGWALLPHSGDPGRRPPDFLF